MSSVFSRPSTEQSLFDDENGSFINAVEFEKKQTPSNFHTDIIRFFKESGLSEVRVVIPWEYDEKEKVYGIRFFFTYDGYRMMSIIIYNDQLKVCSIRVS